MIKFEGELDLSLLADATTPQVLNKHDHTFEPLPFFLLKQNFRVWLRGQWYHDVTEKTC